MSANRDIGTGLRDEWKSLNGSDTHQQEEKAKQASREEKSSSSTPTLTVIPVESELGDTTRSRRAGKEEVQDNDERIDKRHFLFDMRLTPMDVRPRRNSRLFIPVELALKHFPSLPKLGHQSRYKEEVKISSTSLQDRVWSMTITYDPGECGFFLNSSEWYSFSECHHLRAKDVIRFFTVVHPGGSRNEIHYVIEHVKSDAKASSLVPEFRQQKFLFERKLSYLEVNMGTLYLPKRDVSLYFRGIGIPARTHRMERMYFTDAEGIDWCVKITFKDDNYVLVDGWQKFLTVHRVEQGNFVRFYKPVQPIDVESLNGRHFLIQHVKREERAAARTSNDPSEARPSRGRKDGKGSDKGGRKHGSGGGRRSDGGDSKGKKFGVGHCCMA